MDATVERHSLSGIASNTDHVASAEGASAAPSALPETHLEGISDKEDNSTYTSSKGIIFKLKPVAGFVIMEAVRKLRRPPVPTYYNTEKEVTEENPNHPDYQAALQDYDMERGKLTVIAQLGFGTEVVKRPDDIEPPESTGWSDDLKEELDIDVPVKGKARYSAWLRLYALTDDDFAAMMQQVRRMSGQVPASDVAQAEDAFRNNQNGDSAQGLPVIEEVRK